MSLDSDLFLRVRYEKFFYSWASRELGGSNRLKLPEHDEFDGKYQKFLYLPCRYLSK